MKSRTIDDGVLAEGCVSVDDDGYMVIPDVETAQLVVRKLEMAYGELKKECTSKSCRLEIMRSKADKYERLCLSLLSKKSYDEILGIIIDGLED